MNEKLNEALDHISDRHIAQAAKKRPLPLKKLLAPLAAVLAVVILMNSVRTPAEAVSVVAEYQQAELPDEYQSGADYWAMRDAAHTLNQSLAPFFRDGSAEFLRNETDNMIWCPISAYLSLAMVAEAADGSTRQELLDLLGTNDLETLREQTWLMREGLYRSDEWGTCTLAASAWLDNGVEFDQNVMDAMAQACHASIYQGSLGTRSTKEALAQWLSDNTGGLQEQEAQAVNLHPNARLVLASTALVDSQWLEDFDPSRNTTGPFHAPGGDRDVTYMNQSLEHNDYYWGESYGAVELEFANGCSLWLILPDEGKTVADVLAQGEYLATVTGQDTENSKSVRIDLSLPKFDISSTLDLRDGLEVLGLTELFSSAGDFSAGFPGDDSLYVGQAQQSSRVMIDEYGLKATSFTSIQVVTKGGSPDDRIDFILDRPFLFVLTSSLDLPLFVGVVNQP